MRWVLGAARCDLLVDDGVLFVGESEREIRYAFREQPDGWRLLRHDRGDPPLLEISAERIEDLFRYLIVELGPIARAYRGLEPRVFPSFDRRPGAGFSRAEQDGAVLVLQHDRVRATFRVEDPFGVSRSTDFTHYADLPLEEIARLILTTTIAPA